MTPGKILIAAALKKEVKLLQRSLPDHSSWAVTGLGTDRTLASLEKTLNESTPDLLIFTGCAGQLDPQLKMGEVVVPAAWRLESGTRFDVDPTLMGRVTSARLKTIDLGLTVHVPIVRSGARLHQYEETGAAICDMESAAALMVAAACGVPCFSAKVISDTSETGMMGFYREFEGNMAKLADRLAALIEAFR